MGGVGRRASSGARRVYLAFAEPQSAPSRIVAGLTGGPYAHVELVTEDGTAWTAWASRRAHASSVAVSPLHRAGGWTWVEVRGLGPGGIARAEAFLRARAGSPYDYAGLAAFLLPKAARRLVPRDPGRFLCSDLAADALAAGGLALAPDPRDRLSPNDLYRAVADASAGRRVSRPWR